MELEARQLRVADVVRVPGIGQYEILRVDQAPDKVTVCVKRGAEDPCEETYTFNPGSVVQVARPMSLFGEAVEVEKAKIRKEAEAKAIEIKRDAERAQAHAEGIAKDQLVLRYSRPEGILLCGATRENKDKIKAVRYPKRFRFSRRLPDDCAWYVQRTRDVDYSPEEIEAVARSLRAAGVKNLRVDYNREGSEAAKRTRAVQQRERAQAARERAEDHAAAQLKAKDKSEIRRELRELIGAGFEVRDAKRRERMAERVGQLDAELQRRKRERAAKAQKPPKPVALSDAELKKLAELPKGANRDVALARKARIKAFETALAKGGVKAVRKLRALFRKQSRDRWDKEYASNDAARVVAIDAMQRGEWPPEPERGGGYSESEWIGIEASLGELPAVKATVAQAIRFDQDLAKVLRKQGAIKALGDPSQGSGFWTNYKTPDREASEDLRPVRTPFWIKVRTPSSANELRAEVEKRAERHAKGMAVMLDPRVYDTKGTTAQQASKRLCEYSSDWSRRILERLYGVPFDHSYDGMQQSREICDEKKTVRDVRLKRAREELKTAHRHVAEADRDQAMAQRVLPVFADAKRGGKRELTERRLNDALRRAGFKVSKADKYRRSGGFGVSQYGPFLQLKKDDHSYYFALPGHTSGATAAWRKAKSEDGYWNMLRAHIVQVAGGTASSTGIQDAPSDARKQVLTLRGQVSELETPKALRLKVQKKGREWHLVRKLDRHPGEQLVRKFATKRNAEQARMILNLAGNVSQDTYTALARDEAKRAQKAGIRNPENYAWESLALLMRNNGLEAPSWWPRRERELLAVKPGASVREFEQAAARGEVIALTGPGSLSEAIEREQKQKAKGPAKPKPLSAAQRKKRAAKLREAGEKAIAKGKADFESPRKENTAKRIREARQARKNAATEMLLGEILLNAAKAVEAGKLDYMARVSTRKQVEALDRALRLGQWKRCGEDCKDEDPSSADIEYAKMPTPGGWEGDADMKRLAKLGVTTQAQLHAAIAEYLKCCRGGKTALKEDPIKAREADLMRQRIPGFFPTPRGIIERMVAAADIEAGDRVLEPSAGSGSIVAVIKERHPDVSLDVVELNVSLRDLLEAKGYTVAEEGDFLKFAKGREGSYDAILMNPPFEQRQDARHISEAIKLLKPGGRLVAIAAGGFGDRSDKLTRKVRSELDAMGATIEKLPAGSFKGSGTAVSTVLITARKPAASKLARQVTRKTPGLNKPAAQPAARATPAPKARLTPQAKKTSKPKKAPPVAKSKKKLPSATALAQAQAQATAPKTDTQGVSIEEARKAWTDFQRTIRKNPPRWSPSSESAGQWRPIGKFCSTYKTDELRLTICPAMQPEPVGDCPVLTAGVTARGTVRAKTAIALCEAGKEPMYFPVAHQGGMKAAIAEADRRFSQARAAAGKFDPHSLRPLKSRAPEKVPGVLNFVAGTDVLRSLAPTGIVAEPGAPVAPIYVEYAGPVYMSSRGTYTPVGSVASRATGKIQGETYPEAGVRLLMPKRDVRYETLAKFIDNVVQGKYDVYLGLVPYAAMVAVYESVPRSLAVKLKQAKYNLGHYRDALVQGERIYWLSTPAGPTKPVSDEGHIVRKKSILNAWQKQEGPFEAMPLTDWPTGTSVEDTIQIAYLDPSDLSPGWIAYNPVAKKAWYKGSRTKDKWRNLPPRKGDWINEPAWEPAPSKSNNLGGFLDFPNILYHTLNGYLDRLDLSAPTTRFHVAGPWLGLVWPSDYSSQDVTFDPATGGSVDLEQLADLRTATRVRDVESGGALNKRWAQVYAARFRWAKKRVKEAAATEAKRQRALERERKTALKQAQADEAETQKKAKKAAAAMQPKAAPKRKPAPKAKAPSKAKAQPRGKPHGTLNFVRYPRGASTRNAIMVAMQDGTGLPFFMVYRPDTESYWHRQGSDASWVQGEKYPRAAKWQAGGFIDFANTASWSMRQIIDKLRPTGDLSQFRVQGPWRGYIFPSDYKSGDVEFEPSEGGAVDLNVVEKVLKSLPKTKEAKPWAAIYKARIKWARNLDEPRPQTAPAQPKSRSKPKGATLTLPKGLKKRDRIPRNRALYQAILGFNEGGTYRRDWDQTSYRVNLTGGELATLVRKEDKEFPGRSTHGMATSLYWDGGNEYRYSGVATYISFTAPSPKELVKLLSEGKQPPHAEDIDLAFFDRKEIEARRKAKEEFEAGRQRLLDKRAQEQRAEAEAAMAELAAAARKPKPRLVHSRGRGVDKLVLRYEKPYAPLLLCEVPENIHSTTLEALRRLKFLRPSADTDGCWFRAGSDRGRMSESLVLGLAAKLEELSDGRVSVRVVYFGKEAKKAKPAPKASTLAKKGASVNELAVRTLKALQVGDKVTISSSALKRGKRTVKVTSAPERTQLGHTVVGVSSGSVPPGHRGGGILSYQPSKNGRPAELLYQPTLLQSPVDVSALSVEAAPKPKAKAPAKAPAKRKPSAAEAKLAREKKRARPKPKFKSGERVKLTETEIYGTIAPNSSGEWREPFLLDGKVVKGLYAYVVVHDDGGRATYNEGSLRKSRKAKPKAKAPAKVKAPAKAKAKAKPKPKPKPRRGRYAVLLGDPEIFRRTVQGTQHYESHLLSTHRTQEGALKAARKYVAKRTLEGIIEGKVTAPGSQAIVVAGETDIVAHIRMQMPQKQRRQVVKQAKLGKDTYSDIELGLIRYCNVDFGHRISEAKKRRAEPSAKKAKAKQKRKKPTAAERKAATRKAVNRLAALL